MKRLILSALFLSTAAIAHESDIAPHGGKRVDAGIYRVELVGSGTTVNVHIIGDDGSDIDTSTMSGVAILLIDNKPVRTPLAHSAPGLLSGNAGVAVPEKVKGAVQLTGADGKTVQAKF